MTKEEVKATIISEIEKNGIVAEVGEDFLTIRRGHKSFTIYFYELSFSICAGWVDKYEWTGLGTLSFFYEDTERIWMADRVLFVRPTTASYCAFRMGEDA